MKHTTKLVTLAAVVASLTGCVGSNAVTGLLMEANLKAVDNRYARGGLNMLLAPVYGLTVAADYIVFNSLEFWTGHNPINGKPHIFDSKMETIIDINDDLDPSLTTAPLDPIKTLSQVRVMEQDDANLGNSNRIEMALIYSNGDQSILTGVRDGEQVTYYLDGQLVAQTSLAELDQYAAARG